MHSAINTSRKRKLPLAPPSTLATKPLTNTRSAVCNSPGPSSHDMMYLKVLKRPTNGTQKPPNLLRARGNHH